MNYFTITTTDDQSPHVQCKEWREQQLRKKTRGGGESDTSLLSSFGKDSGEVCVSRYVSPATDLVTSMWVLSAAVTVLHIPFYHGTS